MASEELKLYQKAVSEYAKDGVNYLFHNKGNEHALIILSNLFLNSERSIRIAANKLYNDDLVNKDDYVASMRFFLDKSNTRLFILLTNKPNVDDVKSSGSPFYKMLYNHPAYKEGRIVIKDGEGKSFRDSERKPIHFCTGDERMFRLETDVDNRSAIANFSDEEETKMLNSAFDKAFESISSIVNLSDYFDNDLA